MWMRKFPPYLLGVVIIMLSCWPQDKLQASLSGDASEFAPSRHTQDSDTGVQPRPDQASSFGSKSNLPHRLSRSRLLRFVQVLVVS